MIISNLLITITPPFKIPSSLQVPKLPMYQFWHYGIKRCYCILYYWEMVRNLTVLIISISDNNQSTRGWKFHLFDLLTQGILSVFGYYDVRKTTLKSYHTTNIKVYFNIDGGCHLNTKVFTKINYAIYIVTWLVNMLWKWLHTAGKFQERSLVLECIWLQKIVLVQNDK